ncbi:hypothetical protein BDA96_10G293700 [Sorghum bicolor]|uniref:Uncharacterized protein n=1 Tax=Sorghum bicolor TaxID=4558 RepID=A0A921Q7Z9_SORBI|nr:hypothetical protein BDA96_10G293700 [Sorghum bicolor]
MANRAQGGAVVGDREALFLDAARVLMLLGAMQAFLGLLLWLLGVCLLALGERCSCSPIPRAVLANAAIAIAALKHLFTLWN